MKHKIMLAVFICLSLTVAVSAEMTQQIWDSGTPDGLDALRDFHADKVPGMTLVPAPDTENVLDVSMWEDNGADNFTSNLWGWVTIPETGVYTWYLHADDHTILYVSTDQSMDNLQEVANVDGWVNTGDWNGGDAHPTEEPFTYTAGQQLAVLAIHRDGVGGDNLGIGWIMPGSSDIDYISDFVTNIAPSPGKATRPAPANEADDVLRDTLLSWKPSETAGTHNVYFGTILEDVDSATTPTAAGADVNSFDPGRLEFGQMYYWRVDEVNATPDKTVFQGDVWSFRAEAYSVQIPGNTIVATASSNKDDLSTPDKTIDGSGLDPDDFHSIVAADMWFSFTVDMDPWIQYEFDGVKKLDVVKIWNSNSAAEPAIGWSVKDVQIEYSVDGVTWEALPDAVQLSRAPGQAAYNQYDEIAFNGVSAKYVRLDILSNWSAIPGWGQYGVSEVQFYVVPTQARTPAPASGSVEVLPDTVVTWRAGREADQHTIYVSTDSNAVTDGVAPSGSSATNSYALGSLDLQLDETYYWRVDEVNETEASPLWPGPVWNLSTPASLIVDDFESYTNFSPNRPFQTWVDGIGYSADEFFPVAYEGNGTGAGVGHDIWNVSSPHFDGQLMERTMVNSGNQSLPFYYSNTGGVASQIDRQWSTPQDWSGNGIETLSLAFHGAAGNTGDLFIKINNTKVSYDLNGGDIARLGWNAWNIDLSTVGVNLQNVTSLSIGVDGAAATGLLYIDDIRLHRAAAGELITPVEPSTAGLLAHWAFDGDASDSSGNGHDGTEQNGAYYVAGQVGQAVEFDGLDMHVTVPHADELGFGPTDAFSVTAWVYVENLSGSWTGVVTKSRDAEPWYGIWINTGNNYIFGNTSSPAAVGVWTHVAATYDNEQTRLYLNGSLASEATSSFDGSGTGDVAIGGALSVDEWLEGMVDEVIMYNRALSGEEVLWLSGVTQPVHKPL